MYTAIFSLITTYIYHRYLFLDALPYLYSREKGITKRLDPKDLVVYLYYNIDLSCRILYAIILKALAQVCGIKYYYLRTSPICTIPITKPIMDGTIQPMPIEANGSIP